MRLQGTRRFLPKWQLPKFLKHRTKKGQPGPSFHEAEEGYLAEPILSRRSGAPKQQKGASVQIPASHTKEETVEISGVVGPESLSSTSSEQSHQRSASNAHIVVKPESSSGSKQDQDPDSEWSSYHCILRASSEMEALSPRSSNVQVKPRTSKERAFAAKKAAADREARESKERNFAPSPPEWIIQPPQNEDTLSEKYKTGQFLGKGGFAICYEGELQPRGGRPPTTYALKIVRANLSQKKLEDKVS